MKRITTGMENFKDFLDKNYYYIDKTMLIKDVLSDQVMLYTRPRRFGKTLNMSMLYYFFSNKEKDNAYLFEHLDVSKHKDLMIHQNQYPVIFLTLKDMQSLKFSEQVDQFAYLIRDALLMNKELLESQQLDESYKETLNDLRFLKATDIQLKNALKTLSQSLFMHYHQKVIILIDEYDVPLQSAYLNGYYDEMADFLRSIFSSTLKTNDALERGILTGCLRISKESIFTGLNNFKVRSLTDQEASTCFGFTQEEIDDLLKYYDLFDKVEDMKDWYDGYLFGNHVIYNPWSALNFTDKLLTDRNYRATSFWANTSSNDIVRQYIEHSTPSMKEEFEQLINGHYIVKTVYPELTYREMNFDDDISDHVYSFLLYTGYLKIKEKVDDQADDVYQLVIPNKEVKKIYEKIFKEWFERYQKVRHHDFIDSLLKQDVKKANQILYDVLSNTISYFDNHEDFYHGFLAGFLKGEGYTIKSNRESGDGRFDIVVLPSLLFNPAIIIECKHSGKVENLKKTV